MRTPKKDLCLPVIPGSPADHHGPRLSRSGRWRAVSLLLVHVFMLSHALHWLRYGRTVTPIEPSESMDTLWTGRINAGFIFFTAAILLTFVLGRWLCGWGCHLVAYQDLTNWLLKKLRLRPRAFRSRILLFAPLAAALYMFVWPSAYRLIAGAPQPKLSSHLMTTGFWDTFPQYGIAALTVLVCGVAIIYLLGPKGFCTYACPYGAFFGLADKFSLWRIRVTDACRQCGHCTAVCTSNVKVSEEVNLYKMVVDPGCMKCLDCVSVCPNDALYYGFGLPALRAKPVAPRKPAKYDLTLVEELAAALIFIAAFFSFRGTYGIPFLLSLGIAGVITYLVLKATRLFYAPDVLIQRTRLKAASRIHPFGYAYLLFVAALIGFTVHSGLWRYHDYTGNLAFQNSAPETFGWQYHPERLAAATPHQQAAVASGLHHLEQSRRLGLLAMPENDRELAWLYLNSQQPDRAAETLHRVLEAEPHEMNTWAHLAKVETLRGDLTAARDAYQHALAIENSRREEWSKKLTDGTPLPGAADLHAEWGLFQAHCGDADSAAKTFQWAADYDRDSLTAALALGFFHRRMDQTDAARAAFIRGLTIAPDSHEARAALLDLCKVAQSFAVAEKDYAVALKDRPDEPAFHYNRAYALTLESRYDEAAAAYRAVLQLNPSFAEARANLGAVLMAKGDIPAAAREYEQLVADQPQNPEAAMRLGYIYLMSGRAPEAQRLLLTVIAQGDPAQRSAAQSLLSQIGAAPPTDH